MAGLAAANPPLFAGCQGTCYQKFSATKTYRQLARLKCWRQAFMPSAGQSPTPEAAPGLCRLQMGS